MLHLLARAASLTQLLFLPSRKLRRKPAGCETEGLVRCVAEKQINVNTLLLSAPKKQIVPKGAIVGANSVLFLNECAIV